MHRIVRTEEKPKTDTEFVGTAVERVPAPQAVAVFAAELKSLTNYEVWKRVEAMVLTLTPGQETESNDWWRFRIVLDELQWRLSGLEGARFPSGRLRLAA